MDTCSVCKESIAGTHIATSTDKYHKLAVESALNENCGRSLVGTNFVRKDDKPYCKLCPTDKEQAKQKKLVISALGSKWCEAHFMCMGCFAPLNDFERSKFMDFDTKPFCRRCFDKLPSDTKRNMKKYAESEKKYLPTPA
ncbi:LIM and senescent cell antigen-like-containing domain protein 2 [Boothiomyces sp. JEL0866]|nr:LIM and senescent cell antigen-like-containing domain protein 2 [Boothiomyces sp. JEL0866]